MANPQTQNGHIEIANDLWEALMGAGLNKNEYRAVLCILRYSYGVKQRYAKLKKKEIAELTRIPLQKVNETLTTLKKKNIIRIAQNNGYIYFHKDYEKWQLNERLTFDEKWKAQVNETLSKNLYRPTEIRLTNDKDKCQVCGTGITLDEHHIDGNRRNNRPENKAILCPTHHFAIHRGSAYIKGRTYFIYAGKITNLTKREVKLNETLTSTSKKPSHNKESGGSKESKESIKESIYSLFDFWNSLEIIVHKDREKFKPNLHSALEKYLKNEIRDAMQNYKTVLDGDEYYWTHKWELRHFLQRGLDRFLTINKPLKNFLRKDKGFEKERPQSASERPL